MITRKQLLKAVCLICPNRYPTSGNPCKKQDASCGGEFKDDLLNRKRFLKEATCIHYWLYAEEAEFLSYFKLKK